ncbi:MAG: TonB-dependent receptor [Chitinophagaceae bacterium]
MKQKFGILLMMGIFLTYFPSLAGDLNNTLSGTITDAVTHQALIGATISIPDLKAGAVADVNGHYTIKNLPTGNYLIQVQYLGYRTLAQMVKIKDLTLGNFSLRLSAVEQQEVVVTGQSKATQIRETPIPIVAINKRYLQQNMSTNIIDAIASVPGVTAVTTGPNISKPFIRGLGYNRVLTLYDGMPQEGQQWGDEHGIEVDQYNISRVEIIKGPSSLTYGSDALAGVVNLISTPPAPEGKIIGSVLGDYQTNNGLIGNSVMLSGNKNGFYWLGRVSHKQAKDYQDKIDGRVYATNFNETDGSVSLGINRDWGFSHLDLTSYNDLQGIPDGSRDSTTRQFTKQITEADTFRPIVTPAELNTYSLPVLHQRIQLYRALSTNSIIIGQGNLGINLGFERSIRQEFSHPQYPDVAGLYLILNSYTYDLKYNFQEMAGWNLTTGVNGMYQTNDATKGTDFVIPSYKQFDLGGYFLVTKKINRLNLEGGLRYDTRHFHNQALYTRPNGIGGFDKYVSGPDTAGAAEPYHDYQHTFSGVTGSFGLTYNFSNRFSVKANLARGYRAPNILEISANGAHPGTNIYQLGNPNFKPEFSLQEDIGLDYTSRHISVSLSVFNNDIQNYIFNQKVLNNQGGDSIIVPGFQTFQFAASHAQLYGGEFSIDIHPHPLDWLHFKNSISTVYALNKGVNGIAPGDSAKYLPFIPPFHSITELRADIKKVSGHLRNAFVKAQVEFFAPQNRVFLAYNTETPTPGYTLVNAGIGTDITNRTGHVLFNLSLFANNIFDIAYQDNMSRLKYFEQYPTDPRGHYGIYNMGRNVGIRVSVPFEVK